MISVLLADDQALVRGGFRMILEATEDLAVLGEADNGVEAVAQARALCPDVVLMDVRMPLLDGIAATRRIVESEIVSRVLVLTTFDDDALVYDAMRAGASGFLLKSAPPARLAEAIRTIAGGEAMLDPRLTSRLIAEFVRRPPPGHATPAELDGLTVREVDVLRLIGRGRSNSEIAAELVLGEATVKTHVNRVLRKLNLRDRVQAVVLAYETGLIQPGREADI